MAAFSHLLGETNGIAAAAGAHVGDRHPGRQPQELGDALALGRSGSATAGEGRDQHYDQRGPGHGSHDAEEMR